MRITEKLQAAETETVPEKTAQSVEPVKVVKFQEPKRKLSKPALPTGLVSGKALEANLALIASRLKPSRAFHLNRHKYPTNTCSSVYDHSLSHRAVSDVQVYGCSALEVS